MKTASSGGLQSAGGEGQGRNNKRTAWLCVEWRSQVHRRDADIQPGQREVRVPVTV